MSGANHKYRQLAVLLLAAMMVMVSCGGTPADEVSSDAWVGFGQRDADVVIVNAQGGPMPELASGEFREIFGDVDDENVFLVNVHQAQTKNPSRFIDADITFEEAKAADLESVAEVAAVVDEFLEEGKKVYVVGISFGAFIVQELLVAQGNVADGYLIEVGRLAMPEEVWSEFAEGRFAGFSDGSNVIEVPIEDAGMGAGSEAGDRNMARLAAGLGHRRYLDLLADTDLSNVVYAYGATDEQVDRLTQAEIDFLTDHKVRLLRSDGGHSDTIDEYTSEGTRLLLGSELVN